MPKRNVVWMLIVVALFYVCARAADPARVVQGDNYRSVETEMMVVNQVKDRYVTDVDEKALFEGAIQGMMQQLDPHCLYIPPRLQQTFQREVQGEFGGIGIKIGSRNNHLVVISPLEGTPAFKAGILAGDTIVKINGEDAEDITLNDAVERLTGEAGTKVTITVLHEGENNPVDITITRAKIVVPTIVGMDREPNGQWNFWADKKSGIGYIRIVSFTRETAESLDKAVALLQQNKMRGLVLDLRFNPGGLLDSAVDVVDRFVSEGVIVSTRSRGKEIEQWTARPEGTYPNFPLVVLVNQASASAAEIVSGSLQDHHRAVIVGERSYGKGSVQSVIELGDGRGQIKITTAEYYLPSGRNINRPERLGRAVKGAKSPDDRGDTSAEATWGVEPDINVPFTDQENRDWLMQRRDVDVIRHEGGPATQPTTSGPAAPAVTTPFVDRQLERAVDVLKAIDVLQIRTPAAGHSTADRSRDIAPAARAARAQTDDRGPGAP